MANERFFQGIYWDNLGIAYSGGTFTVQGALGRSLSSANPAYIVLPSQTTPGQFVKYTVTADQAFIDDAGSSEIIDNLFGFTTSVAIGVDVPFFIYAVPNDAETAIQFMLCRQPHRTLSPTSANIGAPDDAVADEETDFWSFDNIDETLYDENPCVCVGSFRMQMSASDDWTVQTISNTDGIGLFQESILFSMPPGQFGADSGTFTAANGGTSAVFSSAAAVYYVSKDGYYYYVLLLSGDGGTDGSVAVNALVTTPFINNAPSVQIYGDGGGNWASGSFQVLRVESNGDGASSLRFKVDGSGNLTWSSFTNGGRSLALTMNAKLVGE